MALAWQPVDTAEDPDVARYTGDPAELIDAAAELLALLEPPAWHRRAACRGQGHADWFPPRGASVEPARNVCCACPVRLECLASALAQPGWADHAGIWGGMRAAKRRACQLARC